MKKIIAALLASSLLLATTACGGSSTAPSNTSSGESPAAPSGKTQILTFASGDTGGTFYPVAATVAKTINDNVAGVKINVEVAKGSPANAMSLQNGEADFGMVSGDVAFDAYHGASSFADTPCPDLRILAAVYPSLSNWMALDTSGIETVDQLLGKRVAVGPESSTTEIAALLAFEVVGINRENTSIENLGLGDAADQVGDGVIDAAHGFAGIPIGGQLNLSNTKPSHLLAYTEEHLDKIIAANGSYYKAMVPAGTYNNQAADVPTFGVKTTVAINAGMDENLVYEMAKALHTHIDDLVVGHASMKSIQDDPKFMCNELPAPLHPGAERYYKEVGLIA